MIPDRARDLPEKIKSIKIIDLSNDTIIWKIPEVGNIVTLKKQPLCIKFENDEKDFKILIRKHFDKMRETSMQEKACRMLRKSISSGIIDGEEKKHIIICQCYIFGGLGLVLRLIFLQKDMQ